MAGICPKCGSQRIHRSHRRGAAEHGLALFGLKPRRCHECKARFATLGSSILFRQDVDRFLRNVTMAALAALAILAVVSAVVWVSRKDAAPAAAIRPPKVSIQIHRVPLNSYVLHRPR
jgi:hypothetical protein